MAFDEVRLPARLAFGSTGGVERRTDIVTLASGFEQRSSPWALGRRRFLIGAGLRSLDEAAELVGFFEARQGRLNGFRFKDFSDFKSCTPSQTPGPVDQSIGTGDGARTVFQLCKTYGAISRPIAKPVDGTTSVAVNGIPLAAEAFSADPATGLVTLSAPPAAGAAVTAGFEFDTPVRFDTERIDLTLEGFETARLVAAPLVEIRI